MDRDAFPVEAVLHELRSLNRNLERLSSFLAPEADAAVFDSFTAVRVLSGRNGLLLRGVPEPDPISFQELKGIDHVVEGLMTNTLQFIRGLPCNNVLVYGPRGTGKSSAVKAVLNKFSSQGVRMIEMPRDSLVHVLDVAELLRDRHEHFIVFCDDLSFEEEETSYRHIKTVLDGGIETRPANMLIYATSNRRHLMPERTADNIGMISEGELHPTDTLEERLSLSDRFGLRFGLYHFDMDTYLLIVSNYARLRKIRMKADDLKAMASRWAMTHGSLSGRTARQFIDDLQGRLGLTR
jgi:predicted AAA+ superfamily ATPase